MIIYKYKIDQAVVKLPVGAKILHIAEQKGELFVWVLTNPNRVEVDTLRVEVTGERMLDYDPSWKFLGTYLLAGGVVVLHIFNMKP